MKQQIYKYNEAVGYIYDPQHIREHVYDGSIFKYEGIEYVVWKDFFGTRDNQTELRIYGRTSIKKFCEKYYPEIDYSHIDILVIQN